MPFPFIIPFIVKGAAIAVKAIIAQKKVAVVTKTLAAATKTYGATTVATATGATLMVVGGIAWTIDRRDDLVAAFDAWERGDRPALIKNSARLCKKIFGVVGHPGGIVDSAHEVLINHNYEPGKVLRFLNDIKGSSDEIMWEMKRA